MDVESHQQWYVYAVPCCIATRDAVVHLPHRALNLNRIDASTFASTGVTVVYLHYHTLA